MKKANKIILIVLAALTLGLIIFSIVMLSNVSGYSLLYSNSKFGSFCVAAYRWFCMASVLMVIFWAVITVLNRHKIVVFFKRISMANHANIQQPVMTFNNPQEQAPQNTTPNAVAFCTECGKQISASDKFCSSCGNQVLH